MTAAKFLFLGKDKGKVYTHLYLSIIKRVKKLLRDLFSTSYKNCFSVFMTSSLLLCTKMPVGLLQYYYNGAKKKKQFDLSRT